MAEREEEVVEGLIRKIRQNHVGSSLFEILADIDRVCQRKDDRNDAGKEDVEFLSPMSPPVSPEGIWKRLAAVDDISVGADRQFNVLTIADIRTYGLDLARVYHVKSANSQTQSRHTVAVSIEQPGSADDGQSTEATAGQEGSGRNGRRPSTVSTYSNGIDVANTSAVPARQNSRRITRSASVVSTSPIPARAQPPKDRPKKFMQITGPRKYLPGTEAFWNEIFWNARNQCEGFVTPRYKAGIATHPAARALYASRPSGIDQVIFGAIETGLPVPIDPKEITKTWMQRTSFVLNRSEPGVYTSPQGRRHVDDSQYANHSDHPPCQIMIIRSSRLREVDFTERERHPSALQSVTSVAHTFRPQGFFSTRPTRFTERFGPQPPSVNVEKNLAHMILPAPSLISTRWNGPPLGVFQVNGAPSRETSVSSLLPAESVSTPKRRERKPKETLTMEYGSPADPLSRATTVSLESPVTQAEAPSWRGLPPPLTTRSHKRKYFGSMEVAKPSAKRQRKGNTTDGDEPIPHPSVLATNEATSPATSNIVDNTENAYGGAVLLPSLPKENQPQGPMTPKIQRPREPTKDILKTIVLEVVKECGGMVPCDFHCISDHLQQKWRARGKSGQSDKKTCMEVIKNLCTGGKIKKLSFTFQRKSGTMNTKSLITSVDVDATCEAVQRLKQNIINALPNLYVPPLGSILEAPSIKALPEAPTIAPRAQKRFAKVSMQKAIVRHYRTHYGIRRDLLGTSPARTPFEWQGPWDHVPVRGSEDALALTFHYQSANYNGNGHARWTNAETQVANKKPGSAKRKTAISRKRLSTVTTKQQTFKGSGLYRSPLESNEKTPQIDKWQLRYACYLCDVSRTTKGLTRYHIRHDHDESVVDEDRILGVNVDMRGRRSGKYRENRMPGAAQEPTYTASRRTSQFVDTLTTETQVDDTVAVEGPRFGRSSRGRRIIWKTKDSGVLPPPLPSSLQDIIEMPGQIPAIDYSGTEDPDTDFFLWELDAVEYWETNIMKIHQQQASEWKFINQSSKKRSFPGLEKSTNWQWQDPDVLATKTCKPRPLGVKRNRPAPRSKPREPSIDRIEDESVDSDYDPTFEGDAEAPPPKRLRRSSTQLSRRPRDGITRTRKPRAPRQVDENGKAFKRTGRPRILKNMSSAEIYRIVVAVVVVRTLTGGISSEIDWSIVQKVCPDRNVTFLSDRWQTLVIKNRQDIASLNMSLQEKYVEAFEKREVPGIDFDNIHGSDWEGIVSWAEKTLDKDSSNDVDVLPLTRDELLQGQTFTFDEPPTLRDALAYTGKQYHHLKEEILASTPAAVMIVPPPNSNITDPFILQIDAEAEELDPVFSLAKSWALATVLTPSENLDTRTVTRKLATLAGTEDAANALLDTALRALQRNLVIKRNTSVRGAEPSILRMQSGWRISERWFEQFDVKRMINKTMLKAAVGWKRDVIDPIFNGGGEGVKVGKTQILSDGSMVAIINLLANGRARILPGKKGLPRGRYGLDSNATNYNTKGISRLLTLFDTLIRPVSGRYEAGDPMASQRQAIPTWEDEGNGRIPCWVDMNGTLNKEFWEMVICAVVGLVSGRPGIGAVEIERSLSHGLAGWEVETVLSWLEGSGFIAKTKYGVGWGTTEWWWMVCGYET